MGNTWVDADTFEIMIRLHTDDARRIISHPERVKELVGAAFDGQNLQEDIDYTLTVTRRYKTGEA